MMTAGTPTTEAIADLVTLDSDGWTVNWTTADATAREILALAIGDAPAAGSSMPVFMHNYKHRRAA
jgi:hypothetical protein